MSVVLEVVIEGRRKDSGLEGVLERGLGRRFNEGLEGGIVFERGLEVGLNWEPSDFIKPEEGFYEIC